MPRKVVAVGLEYEQDPKAAHCFAYATAQAICDQVLHYSGVQAHFETIKEDLIEKMGLDKPESTGASVRQVEPFHRAVAIFFQFVLNILFFECRAS